MAGGVISGSGTITDPYLIEDDQDVLNVDSVDGSGKYFELTQDINMGDITLANNVHLFSFNGRPAQINGRGFSISNYSLNFTTTGGGSFSTDNHPVSIINLGLNCNNITTSSFHFGVLIGSVENELILKKVFVTVKNINSSTNVLGCMIGRFQSSSSSSIENSYAITDSISGYIYVAGFIGIIDSPDLSINNCYSYTKTMSAESDCGGFIGRYNSTGLTIDNCFVFTEKMVRKSGSTATNFGAFSPTSIYGLSNCFTNSDISYIQG